MFLQLAKVLMNFYTVIIAQTALYQYFEKDGCCNLTGNITYHTLTINWVLCSIFVFYFNFVCLLLFLVTTRIFKFRTIREKAGLGENMRNTVDFL